MLSNSIKVYENITVFFLREKKLKVCTNGIYMCFDTLAAGKKKDKQNKT